MNALRRQLVTSIVAAAATAAVLGAAGVVLQAPANERDLKHVQTDLARIDARCERIENLLLERK